MISLESKNMPMMDVNGINAGAIQTMLKRVSPFTPIESKFPKWLTAKLVADYIPLRLNFKQSTVDKSLLEIDFDWITILVGDENTHYTGLVPPEDKDQMAVLLENVCAKLNYFMSHLNMEGDLSRLVYQILDQLTIATANNLVREKEDTCDKYRLPTPMQVARHMIGVERSLLMPNG